MKKLIYSIFFFIIIFITAAVTYLSTIGYETTKFNQLIREEIKEKEPNIEVLIKRIKIKLDLKKFNLFLATSEPTIVYQDVKIPVLDIKAYFKLLSLLEAKPNLERIILNIGSFKTQDLQKIAVRIKPSNFKSYLLNNIIKGEVVKSNFDLSLSNNLRIKDYKINGKIKNLNTKISKDTIINDISFNFVLDKNLILLNSIKTNFKKIFITNGTIKIEKKEKIEISGKFNSKFDLKKNEIINLFSKRKIDFFEKNIIKTRGTALHEFALELSSTLELLDYDYSTNGKIDEAKILFKENFKPKIFEKAVKKILFEKTNFKINLNKKNKNSLILEGNYKTNNSEYKKLKVLNNLNFKNSDFTVELDMGEDLFIDLINFKTNKEKKGTVKSRFIIGNNGLDIRSFEFNEEKNLIKIKNLKIDKKNQIDVLKNIKIYTFKDGSKNNDFEISFGKKVLIKGQKYDATFLLNQFTNQKESILLKKINNEIEIDLKTLFTKSLIPLNNFRLIGKIEKGEFVKISSKSEFKDNKYLDISLKRDEGKNRILEVYSDLPRAILADYKFFEGIKEGKLLYTSVIDKSGSVSKLTIENFKVTKAPAFATLLTLADLGGIADLLSGDGMSFDILEINLKEDKNTQTIEEILALGPSVSLQLDGYIEKKTGLVSLSGTMVPAKMLNNLISKIPVVGDILVGEKAGEGVFGVSFKMKGLPGKIKTTVNPVKTLTPRFITRALEKRKKEKSK